MLCASVTITATPSSPATIERIAAHLKSKATMSLARAVAHPLKQFRKADGTVPTPWSEGIWSVFINDVEQLQSATRYLERHPLKEGLPLQTYSFVQRPES